MSDSLKRAKSFRVRVISTLYAGNASPESEAEYAVLLKRPDKFAVLPSKPAAISYSYICNGKVLCIYSFASLNRETFEAPKTPGDLLTSRAYELARPGFQEASFMWMLSSDAEEYLLHRSPFGQATAVDYLEIVALNGVTFHLLEWTTRDNRFRLWIEVAEEALPRRLEITDAGTLNGLSARGSAMCALFEDWKTGEEIPDAMFTIGRVRWSSAETQPVAD